MKRLLLHVLPLALLICSAGIDAKAATIKTKKELSKAMNSRKAKALLFKKGGDVEKAFHAATENAPHVEAYVIETEDPDMKAFVDTMGASGVTTFMTVLPVVGTRSANEIVNNMAALAGENPKAGTKGSKPTEIMSGEQMAKVMQSRKPKVFKIYADWCGACKMMDDDFNKAFGQMEHAIEAYTMDADNKAVKPFLDFMGISGLPTVLYINTIVGNPSAAEIESHLNKTREGGRERVTMTEDEMKAEEKEDAKKERAAAAADRKSRTSRKKSVRGAAMIN